MNRKEIIVFSVFVNMALITILFISALRPTLKGEMNIDSAEVVIVNETKSVKPLESSKEIDQVDQILKEYIAKAEAPKEETIIAAAKPAALPVEKRAEEKAQELPKVEESSLIEVIVRSGDVLEKIARRHNTTVEEIMTLNKMKDTRLRIGQTLYLRENTRKKAPMAKHNTTPNKSEEKYYVVKKGDSVWTVAIKNHIKVADLLRLNNLNEAKAKKIQPGVKLRIR